MNWIDWWTCGRQKGRVGEEAERNNGMDDGWWLVDKSLMMYYYKAGRWTGGGGGQVGWGRLGWTGYVRAGAGRSVWGLREDKAGARVSGSERAAGRCSEDVNVAEG